ncbi:MAG: tape measure protein [Bacteroides sp.]|nr:tape measure protein [Bacteroides sp.]
MALTPISAKASLDATEFTAGVMEIKKRLNELNTAYESNKVEMKQLSIEMNKLEREKRKLTEEMKDGGTDEQKKQLETLKDRIAQVVTQLGSMRTKETELKSELKAATRTLEEEKKAVDFVADSLDNMGDETKEAIAKTNAQTAAIREAIAKTNAQTAAIREATAKTNAQTAAIREATAKTNAQTAAIGEATAKTNAQTAAIREATAKTNAQTAEIKKTTAELKLHAIEAKESASATEEFSTASDTAKTSVLNLGTAIKAIVASAAAKTLWTALIGSNAEMEQSLTAFTVLLGDAEEAKRLVAEMTDFAASTPLELTDVTAASQTLMNYGVAAEDVIEKLTRLGDLAGGNAEKLDRVSLAYGQILAKGKVTGEELRQMTEAGVPLLQALADTLGKSAAEVQDMISKSKVGIDDLDRAIESLTTWNGKFAGMMEQQSQTMTGMLSTARDLLDRFFRDVGEESFEEIKDALSELLEKARELEADGTLSEWAKKLGDGFADAVRWAKEIATAVLSAGQPIAEMTGFIIDNKEAVLAGIAAYKGFTAVRTIINTATQAIQGLNAAMAANPAGLVAAAIGALIPLILNVVNEMNAAKNAADEYSDSLLKINQSAEAVVEKSDREAEALNRKIERYNKLRLSAERTAAEEAELRDISSELQSVFGESVSVVNGLTGEYNDLTDAAWSYTRALQAQAQVEAEQRRLDELYSLKQEIEEKKASSEYEYAKNPSFQTGIAYLDELIAGESFKNHEAQIDEFNRQIKSVEEQIDETASRIEERTRDYYETVAETSKSTASAVSGSSKAAALSLEEIREAAENSKKATGELAKETKSLSAAFAEQNEDGSLSVDTILSLMDAGYAAALAIDAETGAVRLDTEAYKELAKAKLEAQKADLIEQRGRAVTENIEKMKAASGSGDHQRIAALQKENEAIVVEYDVQIAALDSIDLDRVTSGTYGNKGGSGGSGSAGGSSASKSTAKDVSGIESEMKFLSDAFAEQNKAGEIGIETANKLISLGYAEAVVTDQVTGKITFQKEKVKSLYDEKVDLAKNAEGATRAEIDLLDLLKGKYGEVEAGVYGVSGTAEKELSNLSKVESSMQTLSDAFTEQKANGSVSDKTARDLLSGGYGAALKQNGDGTFSLDQGQVTGELQNAIQSAIAALNQKNEAAKTDEERAEIEAEIAMWKKLSASVKDVTSGIYEAKEAQSSLLSLKDASSNMRTLSEAFAEQKENGGLSTDTISDLAGTRYGAALTVGVDGKVTLDPEKIKAALSEELDRAIRDLEEQLDAAEEGDIPALRAQIQALGDLKSAIGEVAEGLYGVEKAQEKIVSDEALKATEDAANKRLKQIDAELKAKQKLRDETLRAIDDEVKARQRLTEDNDIQRQIDQVSAQLKYSQLDEFSRAQLERKMMSLQNDKADMLWERGVEDRRTAANDEYDAAAEELNAEKEAINDSLEVLRTLNDTVATGIADLGEIIKEAMESIKPDSTFQLTINNADKMTTEQLYALIEEHYGSTGAI